jgi:hypothetical protein
MAEGHGWVVRPARVLTTPRWLSRQPSLPSNSQSPSRIAFR